MIAVCIPLAQNGQYQTQWDYLLSSFEPDRLYVIGDEKDAPTTNVFASLNAVYVESCADLPADLPLIVFASKTARYVKGVTSLVEFTHPADAVYFFGHDVRWVDDEVLGRVPDEIVYVPTDTTDDLWSWVAGAVALWDRRTRRND